MENKRIKVLISAYACEPHKGSEPGVGWNWAKQIAKFADVWVITRANNRDVIESELKKNPDPNLHFGFYDIPGWLSFWKKKARALYLYYLLWQLGAYRSAKKMHKQKDFDVVHQITFGNICLPTFIPFLKIPFIWGPVGGGEHVPSVFKRGYDFKSKIRETLRDIFIASLKVNLLFLYACKKANVIIAKTRDTAKRIPFQYSSKVLITTDVAATPKDLNLKYNQDTQIISVGKLDAWRGFDLLIRAFIKVVKNHENIKLLILGGGSGRKRLQKICEEKNVADKVYFAGHVNSEKYLEYMRESSILVNPSLKEGGVTVLFDALSFGLPVICLDIPGAPEIITDDCGIKIKPIDPEQTINELAAALMKLVNDTDLRKKMGMTGKKWVEEHYTWEKKGEFIRKVYEEVLGYRL